MRQVVLDTETTGLDWTRGHRVVEVGCIELLERRPTGRRFQRYFNPGRDLEIGAQEVTGLTLEFLADKPTFDQVALELLDFIRGAELIIHNAEFDVGFLDNELGLLGPAWGRVRDHAAVLDTLGLARERYPGQRNSLDALCRRLGVDNAHRKLHGALLDAELLTEVYLAMTSGQGDLVLAPADAVAAAVDAAVAGALAAGRRPRVLLASPAESDAHLARLARIAKKSGGRLLWPAAADEAEASVDDRMASAIG
jgi:DNA polymerase III subunit epsilon